jgi:hypothetical protein
MILASGYISAGEAVKPWINRQAASLLPVTKNGSACGLTEYITYLPKFDGRRLSHI